MAGYVNQSQIGAAGKIRNGALSDKMAALLESVGQETGVHFDVQSGGQSGTHSKGTYKHAGGWTGSHRHDDGNSGDVKAYTVGADGSKHYLDFTKPADQAVWSNVVKLAVAGGATGIGAGEGYMGGQTVHIGFGKPATWGDGQKSVNTPQWLRTAYADGQHLPPGSVPSVGTALDTIDRAFPRPMPSQIASAYAPSMPPPIPRARPATGDQSLGAAGGSRSPGAMANTTTLGWDPDYGHTIAGETIRGTIPPADYARARLTAGGIPPIPSNLGQPANIMALGQRMAGANAPLVPRAAGITPAPVPAITPTSAGITPAPSRITPMPPAANPAGVIRAPRVSASFQPLPSDYTLNPDALVGAAKKAGVLSGPASWLPTNTVWNGAFGQPGMRSAIEQNLPAGSYLDNETIHVKDPQTLATSYLDKVPSLFRPMAREAVIPAMKYAESQGYMTPQWPSRQTVPFPVPRPTPPNVPIAPPTLQDTLSEQMAMRHAAPTLPPMPFALPPNFYRDQQAAPHQTGYAVIRTPQQVQEQQRLNQFLAPGRNSLLAPQPMPGRPAALSSAPRQQNNNGVLGATYWSPSEGGWVTNGGGGGHTAAS